MNPYARIDIPKLLERLGIQARVVGSGEKLAASCPNPEHDDKRASWFIRNVPGRPYHGAHACQGCKFRGGPNILVETIMGLHDDELREYLSNLNAPPPLPTRVELEFTGRRRPAAFALPPCFQFKPIGEWPDEHRTEVLRRVRSTQVERWGLGYVTRCRCVHMIGARRVLGRHRNRIAIPVHDDHGIVCAYTARAVGKANAKYVEPGDAEHARHAILGSRYWSDRKYLVVVEGPFDAFACDRISLENGWGLAVAALRGSSPHPPTLIRLAQFENVLLLTDPDKAGENARQNILAAVGRHARVVSMVLPKKTDPAKLVESDEGYAYLARRMEQAFGFGA